MNNSFTPRAIAMTATIIEFTLISFAAWLFNLHSIAIVGIIATVALHTANVAYAVRPQPEPTTRYMPAGVINQATAEKRADMTIDSMRWQAQSQPLETPVRRSFGRDMISIDHSWQWKINGGDASEAYIRKILIDYFSA